MPQILCTFPGRTGDLLWALPSVRAISETYGQPVDLVVSQKYGPGLKPLLQDQPYLRDVVVDTAWQVQETAPITPRAPQVDAGTYDRVFHLGYETWPTPDLPTDIYDRATRQSDRRLGPLDLARPWITPPAYAKDLDATDLAVGFTDEHFELKYGLYTLLFRRLMDAHPIINLSGAEMSPRWRQEAESYAPDLRTAAAWLSRSRCFVGCCSALHVLAVALGVPAVVVEPNPHRHQAVFWPLGTTGPQVYLVLGGDGGWTWDARHTAETIAAVWQRQEQQTAQTGQTAIPAAVTTADGGGAR